MKENQGTWLRKAAKGTIVATMLAGFAVTLTPAENLQSFMSPNDVNEIAAQRESISASRYEARASIPVSQQIKVSDTVEYEMDVELTAEVIPPKNKPTPIKELIPEPEPEPEPEPKPAEVEDIQVSAQTPAPVQSQSEPTAKPRQAPAPTPQHDPVPASTSQEIAYNMVSARGWGEGEFSCLVNLWNRESNWNHLAQNPSSGAYGIPQSLPGNKMATHGSDWQTNPATQIAWGIDYISGRYGTPCGAWNHSERKGWY